MLINGRSLKDQIIPLVLQGKLKTLVVKTLDTKQGLRLRANYREWDTTRSSPDNRFHRHQTAEYLRAIADAYELRSLVSCCVIKTANQETYYVDFVRKDPKNT